MRAKRISIIMLLVTIFIFGITYSVANAATDTDEKTITIENRSDRDVTVTLALTDTSPISYTFRIEAGDTEAYKIKENKYLVRYTECFDEDDAKNGQIDFYINMEKKNYTLTIYGCAHQPSKLRVSSHLSEDVTIELYGYDDYEFDIQPDSNLVRMYSGVYLYTYEACEGKTFTGEIFVTKNGLANLILHSCEWFTSPAQVFGGPNPVGFKIVNHASFPVIMTLIGPDSYLVTADFGVNRLDLVRGTYKFSYYQDLQLKTGSFVVTPNGMGVLVITPSFTIGLVDDEVLE